MRDVEHQRMDQVRAGTHPWRRFGPYLSERQWGTVREDYSSNGTAWDDFPHDDARSRAYRWGEDGIGGFSDDQQQLCLGLALWNTRDANQKQRLFGLTGIAGGDRREDAVHADHILQGFVLGNKVVVGSVNGARQDFEQGVSDLVMAEALWPGWLDRLLTHRVNGLERYAEMIRLLTDEKQAVKVYVQISDL